MEVSRSRPKRYFGMTGSQVVIIGVMALLLCAVLSAGLILALSDSGAASPQVQKIQPTYTPLPTYTPRPTYTPQSNWPLTWTPTPNHASANASGSGTDTNGISQDILNRKLAEYENLVENDLNVTFSAWVTGDGTFVKAIDGRLIIFITTEFAADADSMNIASYWVAQRLATTHNGITCEQFRTVTQETAGSCPVIDLGLYSWRAKQSWAAEITWDMLITLQKSDMTMQQFKTLSHGKFVKGSQ